jgi:hypothetical protein
VPLIDKAIKLTWTLRDSNRFPIRHLLAVERRGVIEKLHPGEEGDAQRVSDLIVRALRKLKWPSRMIKDDPFYQLYFQALIRLHELGVHQEVAEDIFRTRFIDVERWGSDTGWAVAALSGWLLSLLRTEHCAESASRAESARGASQGGGSSHQPAARRAVGCERESNLSGTEQNTFV